MSNTVGSFAPTCHAVIYDRPGAFIRPDPPRRCGKPAPWHHNGIGMDLCDECHAVMSAGRGMLSNDWTHTPNDMLTVSGERKGGSNP